MANDVKSGIGYLIPASGVVGFIIALLLGAIGGYFFGPDFCPDLPEWGVRTDTC